MTYSIIDQNGTTTKFDNIDDILNGLPDNTNEEISPEDVRNAVYSNWESIMFKPTYIQSSTYSYIGIDRSFIKDKIFIGKRNVGTTQIMNSSLMSSDSDIFFFTTGSDSGNQKLKISFLSGTNSTFHNAAPYLLSNPITSGTHSYLDFQLNNPSQTGGNISLKADTGKVILNGIQFPKYNSPGSGNTPGGDDGDILRLRSTSEGMVLTWEDISSVVNITNITSGSTVSISGNPVLINGNPLEFTESIPVPQTVGGITTGSTFSNVPIVEMMRRLLYPYLPPAVSIQAIPTVAEVNVSNNLVSLQYSVTKISATSSMTATILPNTSPIVNVTTTTSGSTNGIISDPAVAGNKTFTITASDNVGSIVSQSATQTRVYPFFYGVHSTATNNNTTFTNTVLPSLTKVVKVKSNSDVPLLGSNVCIYFAYPASYGDITLIQDNNGFDITSAFVKNVMTISSPSPTIGYWSGVSYNVYIYGNPTPITTTVGAVSVPVQFKFNF